MSASSGLRAFPCGNEPAREGGMSADEDASCTGLFASKLAPTLFCGVSALCVCLKTGVKASLLAIAVV
jgi:hypothetical protein